MANERNCVFCGEKLGMFQFHDVRCADTLQQCCKTCLGAVAKMSEAERCRRVLHLGFAVSPEKLQAYVELGERAESRRPSCSHCGTKLRFLSHQYLDNSHVGSGHFAVIPAYCQTCGKCELYLPEIVEKDAELAFLIRDDATAVSVER